MTVTASKLVTNHRARILLAFFSFVVLSFPEGLLGVAWPSIRANFNLSLDALGTLLLASTTGHITTSFSSGFIIRRIGLGHFLLLANLLRATAWIAFILSPSWSSLIIAALAAGSGAGGIDVGLNAYFAANHSSRLMNWLHASFGLGVTIGPAVMTAILAWGHNWRWGYAVALGLQLVVVLLLAVTLSWWHANEIVEAELGDSPAGAAGSGTALRLLVVWLSMVLFFLLAGTEMTAGTWSFSLFTEARGVGLQQAGLWVSIYWGSFTLGRILFGFVSDRVPVVALLRTNIILIAFGAVLLWLPVAVWIGFVGLALIGFALAPLFPLLILETPRYVGRRLADSAIGFQIGAAGLGLALVPGLTGILAERASLEVVGPLLFVAALAMFALHEWILRRS